MVQEYIYFNGLYLREPEYKPILRARAIGFEEKEKLSEEDEAAALEYIFSDEADGRGLLNVFRSLTEPSCFSEIRWRTIG